MGLLFTTKDMKKYKVQVPQWNEMLSFYCTALGFIIKKMKNRNWKRMYKLKNLGKILATMKNVFKRESIAWKNLFAFVTTICTLLLYFIL